MWFILEYIYQFRRVLLWTLNGYIWSDQMLAKLASGMNKPAQQTVVPSSSVKKLLESLPIKKMSVHFLLVFICRRKFCCSNGYICYNSTVYEMSCMFGHFKFMF